MVRTSLGILNAHGGGLALGTAAAPPQSEPARPAVAYSAPVQNDEALIAANHAAKRERLARRRAEQQLTLALQSAANLGVSVSTEQIVTLVVTTVDDVRACARR